MPKQDRKIRIAFFESSVVLGGAERQLGYLIENVSRSLFDVYVIKITRNGVTPRAKFRHVTEWRLEFDGRLNFRALYKLCQFIRKNEIEILQSQMFLDNQIARLAALLTGTKAVTGIRGGPTAGPLRTAIEYRLSMLSRAIVVNSKWLSDYLVNQGVPKRKIRLVYNGIRPQDFAIHFDKKEFKQKKDIPVGSTVFGIIARLHPMKGHETFLEAARLLSEEFHDAFFLIVGEGPQRLQIERMARNLCLEKRCAIVAAPRAEIPLWLNSMDVLLLTSKWGESLPNVILEAFSAGVPVVASKLNGIPELIENGKTGFLATVGDHVQFAGFASDLARPGVLRSNVVESARRFVDQFSMAHMVQEFERIYVEIIMEGGTTKIG